MIVVTENRCWWEVGDKLELIQNLNCFCSLSRVTKLKASHSIQSTSFCIFCHDVFLQAALLSGYNAETEGSCVGRQPIEEYQERHYNGMYHGGHPW